MRPTELSSGAATGTKVNAPPSKVQFVGCRPQLRKSTRSLVPKPAPPFVKSVNRKPTRGVRRGLDGSVEYASQVNVSVGCGMLEEKGGNVVANTVKFSMVRLPGTNKAVAVGVDTHGPGEHVNMAVKESA